MGSNKGFFEPTIVPVTDCTCPNKMYDRGGVHWPSCPMSSSEARRYDAAPNRHALSQMFHDLLVEAGEMHDRKQADYGIEGDPFYNIKQSANWGIEPWVGAMMRADDKMGRLRSMALNGGELVNEPVEDSLMDIAVYALIALVLRKSARSVPDGEVAATG